jgi:hypothetical protein
MTRREIIAWKRQRKRQLLIYEDWLNDLNHQKPMVWFIAINGTGMQYAKQCLDKLCGRKDCLCTMHRFSHSRQKPGKGESPEIVRGRESVSQK